MSSDPISKYDFHGLNYCTAHHDTYPFISPLSPPGGLAGRYLLVTGASMGIGRAIAVSFARAGAAGIAILARSSLDSANEEIIGAAKAAGHEAPNVVMVNADVTSQEQVSAAASAVKKAFNGRLDVIVLNAGVLEPIKKMADQDPVDWWRAHEVSTLGSFLCLHFFIPLMRATPDGLGTVVGISSIGASSASQGFSGLQTAKLALSRLMEHVNSEYGVIQPGAPGIHMESAADDGSTPLLAYSIHPGAVAHPGRTDLPKRLHDMSVDKTELAGDTTVWLVKERREWLAGRFINVNWNMEEFLAKRSEIEKRDLLKFRLAMGGEDLSLI